MNVEDVLRAGIKSFNRHTGKPLNDWQTAILRGDLEKKTYRQIAEDYGFRII